MAAIPSCDLIMAMPNVQVACLINVFLLRRENFH
jgi:hypothetical protein